MIINNRTGFSALLTVLIIGVVVLIMAISISSLGMGELDMSTVSAKGSLALTNAEACIEEGMRRIRMDVNYFTNNDLINIGSGQCLLTISGNGGSRRVFGEGIMDTYRKKIEVNLSLIGREISISSWEEVSE